MAKEAVHPDGVIAGGAGDDGIVRQALAEPGDDPAELHRTGIHHRRGPSAVVLVGGFGAARPRDFVRRLQALQRGSEGGRAGVDGQRRPVEATEFFSARMNMDQRLGGLGDVDQRIAGGLLLAHAPADEHEQVRLPDAIGKRRIDADADIAGIIRMLVIEQALAAPRAGDGKREAFGEALQRGNRRRRPARPAGNDERLFRPPQHLLQLGHLGKAGMGLDLDPGARVGRIRSLAQDVLGQRQHDRAGTAGGRLVEGAADGLADAVGAVDLLDPLRHLAEHAAEIDLLKRLAPAHGTPDLADEDDHRGRILAADMDSGRRIGGARSARHHEDAGAAGELAPGFGRHGRAALLAAQRHGDCGIV